MNILILNQDWFAADLRRAGHVVCTVGLAQHLDHQIEAPLIHLDTIISQWMPENRPDVIIALDNSAPIMVQGLDETLIPTIFYSVDTHHHVDLHKYLANIFDVTLVAQKDYIPEFHKVGHNPEWFPLWASRPVEPSEEKTLDAVFVGTLNAKLNPERVKFFDALKTKAPVHVQQGNFWEIFPKAEIVMNQTVKGDLNFRVFEAMCSGSVLLTEFSKNGLLDLFEEGKHLITYTKNDVEEASAKIKMLLSAKELCRKIGAAGRVEILAHHTVAHRAQRILEIINTIEKKSFPMKFYSSMANFASLAVKMQKLDTAIAGRSWVAAMKAAEYGLKHNEGLDEELGCFAVLACLSYEKIMRTGSADEFLLALAEKHSNLECLSLAKIRLLLNRGQVKEAEGVARQLSKSDTYEIFCRSENFIEALFGAAER